MTYTVKHTTLYPGGHAADPGYRWVTVMAPDRLREYGFYCDPDGSNVRSVQTRKAGVFTDFRKIAGTSAAKRAPELEAAIKAHLLATSPAEPAAPHRPATP